MYRMKLGSLYIYICVCVFLLSRLPFSDENIYINIRLNRGYFSAFSLYLLREIVNIKEKTSKILYIEVQWQFDTKGGSRGMFIIL